MTEIHFLSESLKSVSGTGGWYGPGLGRLLEGVSAADAAAEPSAGGHSIWQSVLHVIAWRQVARGLLEGGSETQVADEDNWPTVADTGDCAWRMALSRLAESGDRLREAVARFPASRLPVPVPAYVRGGSKGITHRQLLEGVIQHDVYHAGQIAIVRNLIQSS